NFKNREILGIITGVGAAAALIGLMADIKSQVKLDLSAKSNDLNIRVAVDFTPWFYITVLVFLIGAYLSFMAIQRKSSG
ncbi:MAG: ABC transporter permease, partial [Bacteroidota bacterium]